MTPANATGCSAPRGMRRRVKRADGPERVFGEWWKRDPELIAVRDYFRIEDDAGERYWVFRAARHAPAREARRWTRARVRRMVEARPGADRRPGLFPDRG